MLCPNFRLHGVCDTENCPYFHPNLICELCGVVAKNEEYLNAHLKGTKHSAMQRAQNTPKRCTVCDVRLTSPASRRDHTASRRHQDAVRLLLEQGRQLNEHDIIVDDDKDIFECSICEIQIWQQTKAKHEQTNRHKRKERFLSIRHALEEAEKDKHGVTVSPSGKGAFDLGVNEGGRASMEFSLKVEEARLRIVLRSATLASGRRDRSWKVSNFLALFNADLSNSFAVDIPINQYLSARAPLKGTLTFDSQGSRGRFQDRMELSFYDVITQRQFAIVKPLFIIVGDKDDYERLKPIAPYIPKKQVQREPVKEITHGEPPEALAAIKWTSRLPDYELPKALKTILDMPVAKEKIRLLRSGFVPRHLSSDSHARWFHVMLFMEEHQSA